MADASLKAGDGAVASGRAALAFGDFVLDFDRVELRRGAEIVPLRPKAFDLLAVLVNHPGRVMSKDELIAAVWPGVVVTDDSLTQIVHELRTVMGPAGPTLLRTVPRRGYRFDGQVDPIAAAGPADASGVAAAARADEADSPADPSGSPGARRFLLGPMVTAVAAATAMLIAAAGGWWLSAPSAPRWMTPADLSRAPIGREIPALSIIVLPLDSDDRTPAGVALAAALHDDLVIEMARLHNSLVIARDTAATYAGRSIDPRQVAREMGVRYVVRGRLHSEGERLRLGLVLIDGETGVQRWGDTLTIDRAQLLQAVGDFAVAIERILTPVLYRTTVERRAALSASQVTADDLAMSGYAIWSRGVTRDNVLAARDAFERALAIDLGSVRAWQGIQFTTANQLLNRWTDDAAATLRRAEEAMSNLERLDPEGSQTFSAKTFIAFSRRDFPSMLRITTEWSGKYRLPLAFGAHGAALVLAARFDEAIPMLERALRLGSRDPFRAEWQYRLALAHFGAGRYELARDWSQTAADTNASLVWPPIHAAALVRLGRIDAARQAFADHMRRHPGTSSAHVLARLPGDDPRYVEMRDRFIASLRELGLR